jgi:hypothetical protein
MGKRRETKENGEEDEKDVMGIGLDGTGLPESGTIVNW